MKAHRYFAGWFNSTLPFQSLKSRFEKTTINHFRSYAADAFISTNHCCFPFQTVRLLALQRSRKFQPTTTSNNLVVWKRRVLLVGGKQGFSSISITFVHLNMILNMIQGNIILSRICSVLGSIWARQCNSRSSPSRHHWTFSLGSKCVFMWAFSSCDYIMDLGILFEKLFLWQMWAMLKLGLTH